jgi:hypothetical protein
MKARAALKQSASQESIPIFGPSSDTLMQLFLERTDIFIWHFVDTRLSRMTHSIAYARLLDGHLSILDRL